MKFVPVDRARCEKQYQRLEMLLKIVLPAVTCLVALVEYYIQSATFRQKFAMYHRHNGHQWCFQLAVGVLRYRSQYLSFLEQSHEEYCESQILKGPQTIQKVYPIHVPRGKFYHCIIHNLVSLDLICQIQDICHNSFYESPRPKARN